MKHSFKIEAISVIGQLHRELGSNNQDAYFVINLPGFVAAVVADGCGSSPKSEVGAILTTQFVANYCLQKFKYKKFNGSELSKAVVNYYESLAELTMANEKKDFVSSHFFTTIIGVLLTEKQSLVFAAGDGIIGIDENLTIIDQHNAPDYLAHNIVNKGSYSFNEYPIPEHFQRLMIATDGLEEILENEEPADFLQSIFQKSHSSDDALKKHLEEYLLYDDATVICIKKV